MPESFLTQKQHGGIYCRRGVIVWDPEILGLFGRGDLNHRRDPLLVQGHDLHLAVGNEDLRKAIAAEVFPTADLTEKLISAIRTFCHIITSSKNIIHHILCL